MIFIYPKWRPCNSINRSLTHLLNFLLTHPPNHSLTHSLSLHPLSLTVLHLPSSASRPLACFPSLPFPSLSFLPGVWSFYSRQFPSLAPRSPQVPFPPYLAPASRLPFFFLLYFILNLTSSPLKSPYPYSCRSSLSLIFLFFFLYISGLLHWPIILWEFIRCLCYSYAWRRVSRVYSSRDMLFLF